VVELRGRFGLDAETLVDPSDALLCWFAEGQMAVPQDLDALDRTLATWLAGFEEPTRTAYQGRLRALARRLNYSGPRPVRAMLEHAIGEPDVFERELWQLKVRTGTFRSWLGALHGAMRALVSARLAVRALASERPTDSDLKVELVNQEQIDRLAEALAGSTNEIEVRTRAVLLLAWGTAMKSHELVELQIDDVHLEGGQVVVDGVRLGCGAEAADALRTWTDLRGHGPGPLFVAWDGRSRRLSTAALGQRQLQRAIAEAAADAGLQRITLRGIRNGALLVRASIDREWAQRQARNTSEDGVYRLLRVVRSGA
jgi:integrase